MIKLKTIIFLSAILISPVVFGQKTIDIYKSNKMVNKYLMTNVDSVETDPANNEFRVFFSDESISTVALTDIDSIVYSDNTTTVFAAPTIETVNATYKYKQEMLLVEAKVTDNGGCPITERGIVWSTSPNPTMEDHIFPSANTVGPYFGTVSNVERGKTYYMRPYATNCYGTSYGEEKSIKTMTGNITYNLAVSEDYQHYDLLKEALDSACYYYNMYTTLEAEIYVYQNDGIPTAQAGYRSSIGFGPSTSYMWVGTAMHEFAHYFGSGTSSASQTMMSTGTWAGPVAQALCQELTGDELKGDGTHYWPTGINYASEVTNGVTDLINHAKIVEAMLTEDCGLNPSGY